MKKLMIAAAMVGMAVVANATSYSWSAAGSAYLDGSEGYDEFDGYKIYAFDAKSIALSQLTTDLTTTGISALTGYLGETSVTEGFTYNFGAGGLSVTGDDTSLEPPEYGYAHGYLVLVSDSIDGKQYFTAYDPGEIHCTSAMASGGVDLSNDFVMSALPGAGAEGWTQVAPEPTSGLLLLIGVAGLALRRRRA